MAKGDWWLKLEIHTWMNDPCLRRLSRADRDSWLTACMLMHLEGDSSLSGTPDELMSALHLGYTDFWNFVKALESSKTADVTSSHDFVTLTSRRYERELNAKEGNRLRKQKQRSHADVTPMSRDRVISKSKNKKKEESPEANASALHDDIWTSFRVLLISRGDSERTARSKIGKLIKKHKKEKMVAAWNLEKVRVEESQEPFAYFSKLLDGFKFEGEYAKKVKDARYRHFQIYGQLDYDVPFRPEQHGLDPEEYARYVASH